MHKLVALHRLQQSDHVDAFVTPVTIVTIVTIVTLVTIVTRVTIVTH